MNADELSQPRPRQRTTSEQLLGQAGVMIIRHGAVDYELRVTKRKRLILTKRASTNGALADDFEEGVRPLDDQ